MVAVVLAAIIGLWAAALVVVICDAVEDMRHERDD